jgi:outer membrane protein OmpA-like peptidoglycan-associated protein
MARQQLSALLEPRGSQEDTVKLGEAPTAEEPAPAVPIEAAPEPQAERQAPQPRRLGRSKTPRSDARPKAEVLPPYLTFERKETRLRPEQVTSLNVKARELNKTKDPDADRITDNTLIRVAVDLLLSRASDLAGGDEALLRKSVGL